MEEDRAQVDIGVAVDVQDGLEEAPSQRQPKKRFVGRRQAAEAASSNASSNGDGNTGAIHGASYMFPLYCQLLTLLV